jgi:anti-sigma-K factor RskA
MIDIDPFDKTLHPMKDIEDAQAFAITLEPKGGSVNPTMSEMYVMGSI